MMYKYYLGLGSNIEPRFQYLQTAIKELNYIGRVTKKSAVYETTPWGEKDQPNFLNAVVRFHSLYNPFQLLQSVKEIEKTIGRDFDRPKWSARKIDIDILFVDKISINKNFIKLPHELFRERNFVLIPMSEIAETYKPENHKDNISYYLKQSIDKSNVQISINNW